jgi:hypothetical protein
MTDLIILPTSGAFVVPTTWGDLWSRVSGVHIGGCVNGSDLDKVQGAHYHALNEEFPSWICVRYPHQICQFDSDRPSVDLLHELAHVLTNRSHHDRMSTDRYIWADTMLELLQMEGINPVRAGDLQLLEVLKARKRAMSRRQIYR